MSLKAKDVQKAVREVGGAPTMKAFALREALPVIRAIYDDLNWWKKIVFTVSALIKGIEAFVEEMYDLYVPDSRDG